MDALVSLLSAINAFSPLGTTTLSLVIMGYLIYTRRAVEAVSNNHLSGLPDMSADLKEMKMLLQAINDNIIYVRARINGGIR